ncbi:hypothetical protein GCM10010308_14970 [Streptomyces vinaceusdrappus]|nr:hypothetical protein GCM10010308_14970 [Streptomyces vinaceusdrappus]
MLRFSVGDGRWEGLVGQVRGCRVVLEGAAHGAGVFAPVQPADEPQGAVDAGGDALAGEQVAVDDIAGVPYDGDLAAFLERLLVLPVGGDPAGPGRAGGVQQEGPGADTDDPGGARGGVGDPAG